MFGCTCEICKEQEACYSVVLKPGITVNNEIKLALCPKCEQKLQDEDKVEESCIAMF